MLISLFALCLPQGPDFGWNKPTWHYSNYGYRSLRNKQIEDVTGDGVGDFVVTFQGSTGVEVNVRDGATGDLWLVIDDPGDWYNQHHYFSDLNGDGTSDFLYAYTFGGNGFGVVQAYRGGDGTKMWEWLGRESADQLGEFLELQDADGDGLDDVFMGSDTNGKLLVVNGLSGQRLWSVNAKRHRFWTLTPDWDGDGLGDILICGRGHSTAFSGATGAVIWNVQNNVLTQPSQWQAELSDFNGDAVADVLLVHPKGDYANNTECGVMEVRSGLSGDLLWATAGSKNQRLGNSLHLSDINGDGIEDILTSHGERATALNGTDGTILWDRELGFGLPSPTLEAFADLSGDGMDDLIHQYQSVIGDGYILDVWDGATGQTLWQAFTQDDGQGFGELELVDLDMDGTRDLLCTNPFAELAGVRTGMICAIHGPSGMDFWRLFGSGEWPIGALVAMAEVDSVPGHDVVIGSNGYGTPRFRMAVNGESGQSIWQHEYPLQDYSIHEWYRADADGDGEKDIVEYQYNSGISNAPPQMVSIEIHSGRIMGGAEFDEPTIVAIFEEAYDCDGDGVEEIFLDRSHGPYEIDLSAYSAGDFGWIRGIQSSAEQLSASNGGTVDLELEFPPDQGGWDYQLLLSNNGSGPTDINGLLVPLSPSYWLSASYLGLYPDGFVSNPTGTLLADGTGALQFMALPNQIPSSAIGQRMHAAVVSSPTGNDWEFSSGAIRIEIVP